MALNMITDKKFDQALEWLSKKEGKTKSDLIREMVLKRAAQKKESFELGALKPFLKGDVPSGEAIMKELKEMDADHDLA